MKQKIAKSTLLTLAVMMVMMFVTGITAFAASNVTGVKQTDDSGTSVSISWEAVSGAKYYGIEVSTNKEFTDVVKKETTMSSQRTISGLKSGNTYYVRVGYGTTSNKDDCYANWSDTVEMVTKPDNIASVKFTGADDSTVTLEWTVVSGARRYNIAYAGQVYSTDTNSIQLTYVNKETQAVVSAVNVSDTTGYEAVSDKVKIDNISALTPKITKSKFGMSEAFLSKTYIGEAVNDFKFEADYYGSGFEVQIYNAKTGKKKFSGSAERGKSIIFNDVFKYNLMYKYRVRAYVNTTDGKQCGNWSEYRYFINIKRVLSARAFKNKHYISLSWPKLTGVSKIKIQVSTKAKSGYKTVATLKGTKTSYKIKKYANKALNDKKTYYVRIVCYAKDGKKVYSSDVIWEQKYSKW